MSWSYRIIAREDEPSGEIIYALHEVYFGQEGKIEGWTKSPVTLSSDTLQGLSENFFLASKALMSPVLWWEGDHLTEERGSYWTQLHDRGLAGITDA